MAHFAVHDVFLRVSEETIIEKYKLKRYVLLFSFCVVLNSLPPRFVGIVWVVLLKFLLVFFREWSSRWFLDLNRFHIIVALELLASFQSCSCGTCVFAWICCFWYAFFWKGFGLRWWCFLVRISDFWCKPSTPDLTRMRNRKFSLCILISIFFR